MPSYAVAYECFFFAWVVHNTPKIPAPYTFGYTFVWSFEALLYPACLTALCVAIGRAPKLGYVVTLGAAAGFLGAAIVAAYTGNGDTAHFNIQAATYIPSAISAAVTFLAYYVYKFLSMRAQPLR